MGKKKQKLPVFNPSHRVHFLEIATSPLGKKLSRYGYTEDKHIEALLYLYGFDTTYEYFEEHLDDGVEMRSDYSKVIYKGGSIFTGLKRKDFNLVSLYKYCYGDGVDSMFELISDNK